MNARMSKRRFLQAVGSAAGVGAVYRSMRALELVPAGVAQAAAPDLPQNSGDGKRVAILGAGIGGMTAAYELARAGYRCTILEATGRAGGRNETVRAGDGIEEFDSRQRVEFGEEEHLYANLGPARIPYHHRAILGYCKEFGVELEVFTNDNRAALFHNSERFGGRAVPRRQVITDTRGYIAELLAKAVHEAALDSTLTADDKERVLEMLRRYGDLDADHLYKGSTRGGYRGEQVHAGLDGGEANDPLDFSELLNADFWQYKLHYDEFLNQNPTLLQPVGGMDAITNAFASRVGDVIRFRSIVEEIRNTSSGVRIVYRSAAGGASEAVDADYAICTIPAPVLKDIPNDFTAETRAAIESVEYVPAVKIAFQARRRFWEDEYAIYGGISWTDQDITQIWYPPYGYHRDRGIILGAYIWSGEAGRRFGAMSPEERLRAAVSEGARIHPGYGDEIETGISRAWEKVPFQKGAWPRASAAREALRQPDGPVYFAGDHVSALPGWQEGAILAAHATVAGISERVMAEQG